MSLYIQKLDRSMVPLSSGWAGLLRSWYSSSSLCWALAVTSRGDLSLRGLVSDCLSDGGELLLCSWGMYEGGEGRLLCCLDPSLCSLGAVWAWVLGAVWA